jgi:5-methylthioribose kinase
VQLIDNNTYPFFASKKDERDVAKENNYKRYLNNLWLNIWIAFRIVNAAEVAKYRWLNISFEEQNADSWERQINGSSE